MKNSERGSFTHGLAALLFSFLFIPAVALAAHDPSLTAATLNGGSSVSVGSSAAIVVTVTGKAHDNGSNWNAIRWLIAAVSGTGTCVNFPQPSWSSNSGTTTKFTVTAPAASGTYNAYFVGYENDGCSGDASSTFTLSSSVSVDATAPVIAAHSTVTAEAASASGASVAYTKPTATDNLDASVSVTCLPASGSTFALGNNTVTCNASDTAGNAATPKTFTVTVQDTTKPVIAVHSTVIAEAASASGATVTYTTPTATDAVDGTDAVSCLPASGSTFALGNTTVTCNATDAHSNAAIPTTFTVTVQDTTAPAISGTPTDITTSAAGPSGATVTYTTPTATDAVDGTDAVSCLPASGGTFSVGDTLVTCTSTDSHSNTNTSSFHIIVSDTSAPTLALPSNMTLEATSSAGVSAVFSPTASDDVDGSVAVSCSPVSGSTFAIGTTPVTCSAQDSVPNISTGSFSVTVVDTTAPTVIITPSTQTVEALSAFGVVASYTVSAQDAVDGDLSGSTSCSAVSGSVFAMGTTTITCSVTDTHGNIGSTTATVIVHDTTKPIITAPVDQSFTTTGTLTTPTLVAATSTDTVDPAPAVTYDIHDFPLGVTLVTWTATDSSGNIATTTSSVTITAVPVTPPSTGGGGGGVIGGSLSVGFQNTITPSEPVPAPTPAPTEQGQVLGASTENTATTVSDSNTSNAPSGNQSGSGITTLNTGKIDAEASSTSATSTDLAPAENPLTAAAATSGFTIPMWVWALLAAGIFGAAGWALVRKTK